MGRELETETPDEFDYCEAVDQAKRSWNRKPEIFGYHPNERIEALYSCEKTAIEEDRVLISLRFHDVGNYYLLDFPAEDLMGGRMDN
jgi:hypothetical protein